MTAPVITVVGITEAGAAELSLAARESLERADVVVGGARHLGLIETLACTAECVEWAQPLTTTIEALAARTDQAIVVLASGDPHWHGIANTLVRRFGAERVRSIPAVGAFSLAASALGWPLEGTHCRSVHGHDLSLVSLWCVPGARVLLLTDGARAPRAIADALIAHGLGACRCRVLERLGADCEQHGEWQDAAGVPAEVDALNVLAIEVPASIAPVAYGNTPGLPDHAFVHDGQLTKRSVRALTLARLRPVAGHCLWDLGAGCGSVAIEWVRAVLGQSAGTPERGTVLAHAVEVNPERVTMIEHNCQALGTPYVAVHAERIESALATLPPPNAIFIGGGLSQWAGDAADGPGGSDLIERCVRALLPGGRLVINAVTLETEALLMAAHAQHGGELERIAVSTSQTVGRFTALQPFMPVLQYTYEAGC